MGTFTKLTLQMRKMEVSLREVKMPTQFTSNTDRTGTQVYLTPQPILGLSKLWPLARFCMTCELRMIFTLLRSCKNKGKKEYATEAICSTQSLKYVLAIYRKFAKLCS